MAFRANVPLRNVEAITRAVAALADAAETEIAEPGLAGDLPPLYLSGVRYRAEPAGREDWLLPSEVRTLGQGDCEDLAAWRVGELRTSGEDPGATVAIVQTGRNRYHAVVKRGRVASKPVPRRHTVIEDPSKVLQMQEGRRKPAIRYKAVKKADGTAVATADFGGVKVTSKGKTRRDALGGAIKGATDLITKSPLGKFMPPWVTASASLAGKIVDSKAGRAVTKAVSGLTSKVGKGLKKLGKLFGRRKKKKKRRR